VGKGRLEAFSDGVLAIIITIMVLQMRVPPGAGLGDLRPLAPTFLSYVLSFIYIGIYWNNHHHLLHAAKRVSGGVLWANLHLLFWLSLVPFVTNWIGDHPFSSTPAAIYGVVLLMAAIAYFILQGRIVAAEGRDSLLAAALGRDSKGKLSVALYVIGIAAAFLRAYLAGGLYLLVALMWLVPDRRIERAMAEEKAGARRRP
jgi:uncharacterized membrane protein